MTDYTQAPALRAECEAALQEFDRYATEKTKLAPALLRPLVAELVGAMRGHLVLTYGELVRQRELLDRCAAQLQIIDREDSCKTR